MERRATRRRRMQAAALEILESRQLLSASPSLPPGYASEVASQSFRNARPAPQSPSPHTTRVTVSADRASYAPGEPIRLTITQAVAGQTPVNTGPMGNYDVVVSRRGRELWRLSDDRGPVVSSHVLVTLQPGESRQATVSWDGRARDGSILSGPVEIRAEVDRVPSAPIGVAIAGGVTSRPISPGVPRPQGGRSPIGPSAEDLRRVQQHREQQARLAAEARRLAFERMADRFGPRSPVAGSARPAFRRPV